MTEGDLDVVIETGERLPLDLLGDAGLLSEARALDLPQFDDERPVNRTEE